MIVGERRILIISLIGKAVDYLLKPDNDNIRISCFEKIGCLIAMFLVDNLDAKIRP